MLFANHRILRISLNALLVGALLLGTGCARNKPRNHWWQFWRPKATQTADVYPDTRVLPPPESLDSSGTGSSLPPGAELPPPPLAGNATSPDNDVLRRPATETAELQTVYFAYDSAELSPRALEVLDGNARWMQTNASYSIQIEGHTDEMGGTDYNFSLGLRRAKSVKAYLESKGIPGSQLHVISYGEERPLDVSGSEEGMARNRRAQFLVY